MVRIIADTERTSDLCSVCGMGVCDVRFHRLADRIDDLEAKGAKLSSLVHAMADVLAEIGGDRG